MQIQNNVFHIFNFVESQSEGNIIVLNLEYLTVFLRREKEFFVVEKSRWPYQHKA